MSSTVIGDRETDRNPAVELLRYVGAAGIVWFHLDAPHRWVGHAALDVFIILSVLFTLKLGEAWSRRRVLKVWLFWSAIYACLKVMQAVVSGTPIADEFEWWMLLTGSSLPLWFLPFIYVCNGVMLYYMKVLRLPSVIEGILFGLASALLVIQSSHLPIPLAQWALGFAAALAAPLILRALYGEWLPLVLWMIPILGIRSELLLLAVPVATLALLSPVRTAATWPYALGRLALPVSRISQVI